MFPLIMCNELEKVIITRLNVSEDERSRLLALGFTEGTEITVISKIGKEFIISVRGSRYAIIRSIANNIIVEQKENIKKLKK